MGSKRCDAALFVGIALAVAVLAEFGILERRVDRVGIDDFARIWAGPRAFVLGSDPYDALTWLGTAARLGIPPGAPPTDVYLYPPWVVVVLVPVGALPLVPATIVWLVGGIVAAVVGVRALLRSALPGAAWAHGVVGFLLLASPPAVVTLLTGQWPFWFVAALAAIAWLVRRANTGAAGLVATAMLAKPPLFVFGAAALAVRDLWPAGPQASKGRLVAAALAAGTALVTVSWALLPNWWPSWLHHVAGVQLGIAQATLPTLFGAIIGPAGDWAAAATLMGCVLVALLFDPRGEGWLPVWFALSLTGTVYSNTYDELLLIVPLVLGAGAAPTPIRRTVVLLGGAALLVALPAYLHTLTVNFYTATVPLLTFLLIVAVLWPVRRRSVRGVSGGPLEV